jgi:N-acetylglutamate synthase
MKALIEELSLSAWPALQTRVYDGWILRFAEGFSKRSNSVNPLYPSAIGLEEKIGVCEGLYADQALPCVFKLRGGGDREGIDGLLESRGYSRIDETCLRVADLGRIEEGRGKGIEIGAAFDEAWIKGYCACSGNEASEGLIRRILGNVLPRKIVAIASADGEVAGCGYGVLDQGWVGIFDIVVRKELRGRGFGEGIVRALLGRARAGGAERAYLQVVVGNLPAERLYGKLGFREAYRYWYRKK